MATSFWDSWQLWEKLCFVLGCAIVFVIVLGCLKLVYNHWNLRRYTKLDAAKAALKQQMQHSQSIRRGRANRVPFGVRALESGVEVDGVWISRSNTPASSLPGSPELSATVFRHIAPRLDVTPRRDSTSSDMTRIEISQPDIGQAEYRRSLSVSGAMRNPFDRPVRKHEPPPTSDHQTRGRPTYQPRRSSGLRFSNSFNPEEQDDLALDPCFTSTHTDNQRPERSEAEAYEGRPSLSWSATSGTSGDGNPIQDHEVETSRNGLLHPRYQNLHEATNPFLTPNSAIRASDVYVDNDIADQRAHLMEPDDSTHEQDHAHPQSFDGEQRLRHSQVIRKVNSGFEILRPGTLVSSHQNNGNRKEPNKRDLKRLQRRGRRSSQSSYTLEQ